MWKSTILFLTLTLLQQYVLHVEGHARLRDPPSRSSMFRDFFSNPTNNDDNQLNCGGKENQWNLQGGLCGMCGDPYQDPQPRPNERGGTYGKGSITRTYTEGQAIDIKVDVTANHKGWFEIRVCKTDSPNIIATKQCLDQHLLPIAGSSNTQYTVPTGSYNVWVEYKVQLPMGLSCLWCTIQWKYRAGNNWGTDLATGQSCVGCGPQEEFYGCADVEIVAAGGGGNPTPPPSNPTPSPPSPPTPSPPSRQPPSTPLPTRQPTPIPTTTLRQPPPPTPAPATLPPSSGKRACWAAGIWANFPGMDNWCVNSCNHVPPSCPASHCTCI